MTEPIIQLQLNFPRNYACRPQHEKTFKTNTAKI